MALIHAATPPPTARKLDAGLQRKMPEEPREIAIIDYFPAGNWIWHWDAQMWYMQRCLPGPEARRFSRVLCA